MKPDRRIFSSVVLILAALVLLAPQAFGQQAYVSRYDAFVGYAFMDSPKVSLFEHGVNFQVGIRPRRWYSIGFDYSRDVGDLTLTPDLLTTQLQNGLAGMMQQLAAAGLLPPGYALAVKSDSTTQNFALGPQLAYRHFKHVTLFIRPSIGAIYEKATPKPADPIAKLVVAQLTPTGTKTDWTAFYGVGGGIDFIASRHFALRVQSDFVYDHLFNDVLKDGRYTVRFSVGPAFNFGKNVE